MFIKSWITMVNYTTFHIKLGIIETCLKFLNYIFKVKKIFFLNGCFNHRKLENAKKQSKMKK